MARTKIAPGQVIDAVSPAELTAHLDHYTRSWFEEKARGVTTFRAVASDTIAAGKVTLPGPNEDILGPNAGYAWVVLALRVSGLAANDTLTIFRNTTNPQGFIANLTFAAPWVTFGSKSLILRGDDKLIVTGSGLTATGDLVLNGEGLETAEPDLYKIL